MIESIWYDEGILGGKIGVQQLPLFKCFLCGYTKVKISVSTQLKILKYKTNPIFGPKMPCNVYDCACKQTDPMVTQDTTGETEDKKSK